MVRFRFPKLLLLFVGSSAADFGLGGQLFQLDGQSSVNNAKLTWATTAGAVSYQVQRSADGTSFSTVATVRGNAYDNYGLTVGTEYEYQIVALDDDAAELDQSNVALLKPFTPTASYSTHYNTEEEASVSARSYDAYRRQSTTAYQYRYVSFANKSFSHFAEETSVDG